MTNKIDNPSLEHRIKGFYVQYPFPGWPDEPEKDELARYRFKILAKTINENEYTDGKVILDAGCGTGNYAIWFAKKGNQLIAIDISPRSLEIARSMAEVFGVKENINFIESSLSEYLLPERKFDLVYSFGVLHYLRDAEKVFVDLSASAKSGGLIAIGLYSKYGRALHFIKLNLIKLLTGNNLSNRARWAKILFRRNFDAQSTLGGNTESRIFDQFCAPFEKGFSTNELLKWFESNGVEYISSYPPITCMENLQLLKAQHIPSIVSENIRKTSPLFYYIIKFIRKIVGTTSQKTNHYSKPTKLEQFFAQLLWLILGGDQFNYFTILGRKL